MDAARQRKSGIRAMWVWIILEVAWLCLFLFRDAELWLLASWTAVCLLGMGRAYTMIRKARKAEQAEMQDGKEA